MKRTERGFRIYAEFKDYDAYKVRIVRSSLSGERCVRIQPEIVIHPITQDPIADCHLTVDMAKKVIIALEEFISGEE